MPYQEVAEKMLQENGVEQSTMMKTPCLRYKGNFMAMMFEKEDALIIKVSPQRVNALIAEGEGRPFNFTKKQFKEWVLIPLEYEGDYEAYIYEALRYAQEKSTKNKGKKS